MHISLEAIMSDYKEWQRKKAAMIDAIEQYTEKRMADEYGRIHTDGSRSGGQPLIANRKAHTMIIEVLAEWGVEPSNTTPEQLTIATTEALCRTIKQIEALRQSTQSDVLREALRNIQIEAEREKGSWVHLKRVIALNCKAALQEQSK